MSRSSSWSPVSRVSCCGAARAGCGLREVRALLAEVVQRRRTTVAELDEELRAGPVRGSKVLRQVLDELRDGVRSAPEAELRVVVRSSAVLPPVRWNPRLRGSDGAHPPSPDGWIEDVGLALESDSREFHASPEGWQRTRERHDRLAAYGVLTLHFSPRDVRENPTAVPATIEDAYRSRPRGFPGVVTDDSGR